MTSVDEADQNRCIMTKLTAHLYDSLIRVTITGTPGYNCNIFKNNFKGFFLIDLHNVYFCLSMI